MVGWIIFEVDLGCFLHSSDIVICNLDEPLDPGMIVEMMFAKMTNKPVIGYRTEMKTPFGRIDDFNNGMHFFCYFPCDAYLFLSNGNMNDTNQGKSLVYYFAQQIDEHIKKVQERRAK